MQKISKFNVEINVIPNWLQKYMVFTTNKNLVFIDSMQFMNPSLDGFVKNLIDNDFKYLSQEFSNKLLKLVKQKWKLPGRCEFYSSFKY